MSSHPRRLVAGAVVVATGLAVAGCRSSSSDSGGATTTTGLFANVTTTVPRSVTTTMPDRAGLAGLVPAVGGLTLSSAPGADNGPFDLDKAVVAYNRKDAEARRRLTDDAFVGGYSSTFSGPEGTTLGVQLYKFGQPTGATDFAEYLRNQAMQGVTEFNLDVAGVPGSTAFVTTGQNGGRVGGVLFVKGPYLAYVGASAPSVDISGPLQQLAKAQYDLLPAV